MVLGKKFITTKFLDIESREEIKQNYFNRNEFQRFTLTVCKTTFKYIPHLLTCTPVSYAAQNYAKIVQQISIYLHRKVRFLSSKEEMAYCKITQISLPRIL